MVLELHIWGPAFGLPSIDPQCLATIAYIAQALPHTDEWVLIPSSDPTVSPTNELPALRNGDTWISRFPNIVDYLKKYSAGHWDLDCDLDAKQSADNIAFSSFIESSAQPLLDLSLYVSTENYTTATRPAYSSILHFPNGWTVPPKIRAVAAKRSEHLGLSSLDVDIAAETQKRDETSQNRQQQQLPKSLLRQQKDTLTGLLRQGTRQNAFRLDALTADLYEPLEGLLDDKRYFLSKEEPSSLDCLALGYLSLAISPELPQEWLKRPLMSKYPNLARYIVTSIDRCFGPPISPTSVLDAELIAKSNLRLPWRAPAQPRISTLTSSALSGILDHIPGFASFRNPTSIPSDSADPEKSKRDLAVTRARRREMISQIGAAGVGMGAFVGYLFWEGILMWPRPSAGRRDRTFGGAEAVLGIGVLS